jgi:hypothetical protein
VTALLFIIYTALACWCIVRLPFFKKSGIAAKWLIAFFLLKIVAGCFYGYVHTLSQYYPDKIDTWRWFFESLPETETLKKDPAGFFSSLFHDPYNGSTNKIFSTQNSFWNDFKNNFMIKLMALLNLFSGGRYYVNIVFYSLFAFMGPVALYRLFTYAFPAKKTAILMGCFLLPSAVFWSSGFHKEGIIITLLAFLLYAFEQMLLRGLRIKYLLAFILPVIFIFLLRNYVLFALLPALGCWWLAQRLPQKTALIFLSGFTLFIVCFFMARYLHPAFNLPQTVSERQQEFFMLSGTTHVATDTLLPTPAGFLHNLPAAAGMAFLRPLPGEGGITYIPSTIEVAALLILLLLLLFFHQRQPAQRPLLWFCGAFSITLLLLIGYSIPITGAVIRYRSIAWPILMLCLALQINWQQVQKRVSPFALRK